MELNLSSFLRDLAQKIDDQVLSEKEKQTISEFYLSFKFQNECSSETTDKELVNFLSLGWFIYSHLKE